MSTTTRRRITDDELDLDEFADAPPLSPEKRGARALKPPPEIWELVHPVQQETFKPTQTFASRLANRNVMYTVIGVVLVLGVSAVVWRFRIAQNVMSVFAEPEVTAKPATTTTKRSENPKTLQTSVAGAALPAPAHTEAVAINEPNPTSPAPVVKRITKKPARTIVANSLGNVLKTAAPTATRPVGDKVGSEQNAASSEKTVSPATQTVTAQPAKPKQNSAANSEVVTPAKTNSPTKPKVIQWP